MGKGLYFSQYLSRFCHILTFDRWYQFYTVVLKTRTSFKILYVLVVGDILAVKPPFLFGSDAPEHEENPPISSEESSTSSQDQRLGSRYIIGVALCLYAAATDSVVNVVQVSLNRRSKVTKNHLIIVTGMSKNYKYKLIYILYHRQFVTVLFSQNKLQQNKELQL